MMTSQPPEPESIVEMVPLVGLGQVLAGAVAFKEGNINDTYRGVIWTGEREHTAIIKDLDPRELANEVLAAAIGRQLGLPIPPPYLALASEDRFPAKKGPLTEGGRLVFASVDVNQPQLAMLYRGGGGAGLLKKLGQWARIGALYGFDALVANVDRHMGNLLFSGDSEIWLIDHGRCFTGPQWAGADLKLVDQPVQSKLERWLTPALDASVRNAAARDAVQVELGIARVDVRGLALTNYMAGLLNDGDLDAVVNFIEGRCPHVPRLAASNLGIGRLV